MRRRLTLLLFVVAAPLAGAFGPGSPVEAAPPGPQCTSVRECGPPLDVVERIIRTCQSAYCQFP